MIARIAPGTHNPRISAETVPNRLREIDERPSPPYTMYVLYAAFLFWPSICEFNPTERKNTLAYKRS